MAAGSPVRAAGERDAGQPGFGVWVFVASRLSNRVPSPANATASGGPVPALATALSFRVAR